ncbi:MAG: hypoxanthine phosphoribosyltransferase [Bacteroidia bacterium]|nr:hypoxanthine phosphoribosyltransferase [Bacteroidia bacterium]
MVKIHDKTFAPFISAQRLKESVSRIARQISLDYSNQTPLFISVLSGSFMFTADILKEVTIPCELVFIKVSSYTGTQSSGSAQQIIGLQKPITNRPVIIVEDIVDTGNTIEFLVQQLEKENPASLKIATLFFKPRAYTKAKKIDYVGLEIENDFIVGYGLDYNELGRNLPEVYKII